MHPRRRLRILVVFVALCLFAACTRDEGEPRADPSKVSRGGVWRIQTQDLGFTNLFDPTGEYLLKAFGYYSNLLTRTLLTYRHVAGPEGNELIPDLATDVPEPTDRGLTYTFTLKNGIRFGPPLNREITSRDIEFAFERIGTPSLAAQYGFYYNIIAGIDEFSAGETKSISGIDTPSDKTIAFHLTEPTGDFLYRLAMPAASPMPEEVAGCFDEAGEYGRYVVASGPYMIEGSDDLDASTCNSLEPISGYDPGRRLIFVRNPSYDPATDSPEARENFIDRFEITVNTNRGDIFNKIEAGELEDSTDPPSPTVIQRFATSEELGDRMRANLTDSSSYLSMNLTQPPFDDLHVRRAVNFAMDKQSMLLAWGGNTAGNVATHIIPPTMTGSDPDGEDYDPYPSQDFTGDLAAAKNEIAQSQYDSDGDGVCDAAACKEILAISISEPTIADMVPSVESSLSKIGIELEVQELAVSAAFSAISATNNNIPLAIFPGWGKDYADPSTFMVLFDSHSIIPKGNINHSLVGLRPDQIGDLGVTGSVNGVPSVDDRIDTCTLLSGEERTSCWIKLDRYLMEQVTPWVPYLWPNNVDILGSAVTKYEFDQFSGDTAYAHVAVDPNLQD